MTLDSVDSARLRVEALAQEEREWAGRVEVASEELVQLKAAARMLDSPALVFNAEQPIRDKEIEISGFERQVALRREKRPEAILAVWQTQASENRAQAAQLRQEAQSLEEASNSQRDAWLTSIGLEPEDVLFAYEVPMRFGLAGGVRDPVPGGRVPA